MANTELTKDFRSPDRNPWFLLLEQGHNFEEGDLLDPAHEEAVRKRSKRVWNACITEHLTPEQRAVVLRETNLSEEDIEPLSENEINQIANSFDEFLPDQWPFVPTIADLSNVELDGLDCSGLIFMNLSLDNSQVTGDVDFSDCVFLGSVSMMNCDFLGDFHFSRSKVFLDANFGNSRFERTAHFDNCVFGLCSFDSSQFEGPFYFDRSVVFTGGIFLSTRFWRTASFENAKFLSEAPEFYSASLTEDTEFYGVEWPRCNAPAHRQEKQNSGRKYKTTRGKEAREYVRAYECLKRIAGDQRRFRLEHMFLQLEMYNQEIADGFFASLPSRFFRLSSDFGWSYVRPLILLFSAWLLGALYFIAMRCSSFPSPTYDECGAGMLALSFSNLFGFLGIGRILLREEIQGLEIVPHAELVAGAQMTFGPFLLFLLLLAFRNRFRLK